MIRKGDVQWWTLEAKKHPESAPAIIEELAKRLIELDAENERLRDEVIRLQRRTPAAAPDGQVDALRRRVSALQSLLDGEAAGEPALLLLSTQAQALRLPLSRAHQLPQLLDGPALARLRRLLLLRPQDELLLLTSSGHGHKLTLRDLPLVAEASSWPTEACTPLPDSEWLSTAIAVSRPPRFWTLVTRRGFARQTIRLGFDRDLEQGQRLIDSPLRRDEPRALVDGDRGDLLIVTRWGKALRFPQRAIPAAGAPVIDLEPDDEIVAALPLPVDGEIVVVTAAGYCMRRETSPFAARSQPGGTGNTLLQAYDVLAAFPADLQGQVLFLTHSGRLVWVTVEEIPLHQRAGKGTPMRDFGRDPAVAAVLVPGTL